MKTKKNKQVRFQAKNFLKTNWKERLGPDIEVIKATGPHLPMQYFLYIYHLTLRKKGKPEFRVNLNVPAGGMYIIDDIVQQIKESC